MEDTHDVLALEKISSEVGESQIKVILSSQCIKAQAFLLDKLKKQTERHKETCSFISSANLKLDAEIKQAEHEINSMLIAQETIKLGNIELKKEWLLAKARKVEVTERTVEGKNKYEALWLNCKARYETIQFVQKLLNATEKVEKLNISIEDIDKQMLTLYESMKTRREACIDIDRKRCLELANFMVHERLNALKTIKEKSESINKVTKQIEELMIEKQKSVCDAAIPTVIGEPENFEVNEDLNKSDEDALIPKLDLGRYELDFIDVNLEPVKIQNDEILNTITTDPIYELPKTKTEHYNQGKAYEYIISPYFNSYKETESHNFSKRKLINILEDIHINNNEAYNIVKKVNPENLREVNEISSNEVANVIGTPIIAKDKTINKSTPIQNDTIEEVDMTGFNSDNIIIPPTQFLDITLPSSQDGSQKKRVSFDIPSSLKINEVIEEYENQTQQQNDIDENKGANQTTDSQLDVSVASEDSFTKIKDMILKKHNLDLSPQFVYAKNPVVLQKKDDNKVVTSKFFQNDDQEMKICEINDIRMETDEEPKLLEPQEKPKDENLKEQSVKDSMKMDVDDNNMIVSSPKENQKLEVQRYEKPVSGLLFTHGAQAIPDSLNASISTTGFEDSDFPHCIDSSLLLSPKADAPMTGDNQEVISQEVPNFLSGFRKTGLSFFGGGNTSSDPNPDSSAQNNGDNFSFNFGGEKKNRGGLFSLFQ